MDGSSYNEEQQIGGAADHAEDDKDHNFGIHRASRANQFESLK